MNVEDEVKSRVKWITYNGKNILFEDYTNTTYETLPSLIEGVKKFVYENGYKDLLLLLDFTDSYADKKTMDLFVESGKEMKPIINKTACLGINGIKKVLVNAVNRLTGMGIKIFNSEEDAKKWLTE